MITNYAHSFVLLNQFDSNNLHLGGLDKNITYEITYEEACKAIAELFEADLRTANEHLVNIYLEQELDESSTIRDFWIV